MMPCLHTSGTVMAATIAFSIFACLVNFICIIAYVTVGNTKRSLIPLSIFFILLVIFSSHLIEVNYYLYGYDVTPFELSYISTLLSNIPGSFHLIFNAATLFFACFKLYKLYKINRTQITQSSIKESIENLPSGLLFMPSNGDLYLSNHVIHQLCKTLTDKVLTNGNIFWQELCALKNTSICVINSNEPLFALKNGEIWQFSKKSCKVDDMQYFQIKATNVTELYNLSKNMEKSNLLLLDQQTRLKNILLSTEENTAKQVALDMQVNFHDSLGDMIILTKKTLNSPPNPEQTQNIIKLWKGLTDTVSNISKERDIHALSLEQIQAFAKQINCELIITGNLPTETEQEMLCLLAINEMLKNAVFHAKASEILVDFIENENYYILKTTNKLHKKIEKIEEGAGLSGLRQKVESINGKMALYAGEKVSLFLRLPKNL